MKPEKIFGLLIATIVISGLLASIIASWAPWLGIIAGIAVLLLAFFVFQFNLANDGKEYYANRHGEIVHIVATENGFQVGNARRPMLNFPVANYGDWDTALNAARYTLITKGWYKVNTP